LCREELFAQIDDEIDRQVPLHRAADDLLLATRGLAVRCHLLPARSLSEGPDRYVAILLRQVEDARERLFQACTVLQPVIHMFPPARALAA
jgi:hypothetical protein